MALVGTAFNVALFGTTARMESIEASNLRSAVMATGAPVTSRRSTSRPSRW
jgi:hypothetical protein